MEVASDGHKGLGFASGGGGFDAVVGDDHGGVRGGHPVPAPIGAVPGQGLPLNGGPGVRPAGRPQSAGGHHLAGLGLIALRCPQVRPLHLLGDVGLNLAAVVDHGLVGDDAAGKSFGRDVGQDVLVDNLDTGEGHAAGIRGVRSAARLPETDHVLRRVDDDRVE